MGKGSGVNYVRTNPVPKQNWTHIPDPPSWGPLPPPVVLEDEEEQVSKMPDTELAVNVVVLGDSTVSVAQAALVDADDDAVVLLTAGGHAVRENGDRPNLQVAEDLAAGRALIALGQKMVKRAMGQVKHSDDMREQRRRQQLRKVRRRNAEKARAALALKRANGG